MFLTDIFTDDIINFPSLLLQIIDNTFKLGCQNKELEQDAKDVSAKLSRLKSRLQTDKVHELKFKSFQ